MKLYRMDTSIKKKNGFTLVELIVVLGIMGILATMALLTINPIAQFQKANDAKRKAEINEIRAALEFYKTDNLVYPTAAEFAAAGCGGEFKSATVTYIREMPCDPSTNVQYVYAPQGSAPHYAYQLHACLERIDDKDADTADATTCGTDKRPFTVINP